MKALMIAAAVMLGGCAGGYYSDIPPTPATVEAAGGVQIYKGTAYLPSDFKPSGELRAFGDYDFMVESAPCTVLPTYRHGAVTQEKVYAVTADRAGRQYRMMLECRDRGSSMAANEFRMILLISKFDCVHRTWARASSAVPLYAAVGKLCGRNYSGITLDRIDEILRKNPILSVHFKNL